VATVLTTTLIYRERGANWSGEERDGWVGWLMSTLGFACDIGRKSINILYNRFRVLAARTVVSSDERAGAMTGVLRLVNQ